jgi:YesN/AraC family two-component response regulator
VLKKLIAGQRPELRVIARELGMSTRTLQRRRLTEERATFQQLITEARRELAHHYLRHSSLELNETAYLLGYEDANSFFRAFQQWEGTSPGEWRARVGLSGAPSKALLQASARVQRALGCILRQRHGRCVHLGMHIHVAPPRRKRILIVEDEPDCSDILAHFLGTLYDIVVAHDGIEGIELAAKYEPDLIIADVTMPRLDGVTMIRHIRGRQGLRSPVIFLSALGEPNDIIAGISAGARHYLTKPVELVDLKRRVARALGV